jgi:hypothetical protein
MTRGDSCYDQKDNRLTRFFGGADDESTQILVWALDTAGDVGVDSADSGP